MGCVEFNPVLNFSKGYIGHGDNQAFSLWNNSHYRLVYCLLYQIKAFGLVWADNYALISAPLILEMVFPLFLSSLCPRVKLSCDFVGFWWHSLAVSANGRAVWRITFYLKSGIELQTVGALVHTEGFFLTLCSAPLKMITNHKSGSTVQHLSPLIQAYFLAYSFALVSLCSHTKISWINILWNIRNQTRPSFIYQNYRDLFLDLRIKILKMKLI